MKIVAAVLLLGLLLSIAGFLLGALHAGKAIHEQREVAKALASYGVVLRLESKAFGVPVAELVERDMRSARTAAIARAWKRENEQ